MSSNIDLSKFLSEPSDILERLYKDTPMNVLTKEEFENLPLNENYIKNKEKNIDNNNERPIIHEQEQFSSSS
jgi:hypothetical protein